MDDPEVFQRLARLLQDSGDPLNPSPEELKEIVRRTMSIAVVGASRDPLKPARRVPVYVAAKGAEVYPVNPHTSRVLGRPSRPTLADVKERVDMVLIFRPSHQVGPFIREAAARPDQPVIWLPIGVRTDEAVAEARTAGRTVVQNLCLYQVHRALGDTLRRAGRR